MNSVRYIGMDVHRDTISVAVLDESGRLLMQSVLATRRFHWRVICRVVEVATLRAGDSEPVYLPSCLAYSSGKRRRGF
jgi:hypothetical protein